MLTREGNKIVRRLVFVFTVALTLSLISTTYAYAQAQLVILGLGGRVQEIVTRCARRYEREYEREHATTIRVSYRTLPYQASATALRLLLESDTVDLFIAGEVLIRQIGQLQMLEQLNFENLKERHDLYSYARLEHNYGVAIGTIATGIAYLPAVFEQRGLRAPDSWKDLYQPMLREHIAIPDISTIYGWQNLYVAATLEETGPEENRLLTALKVDEGFNRIEQLRPFYLTDNPIDLANLFREERVWISPCQSDTALKLMEEEGFSLEFVLPEGVPLSKIVVSKARDATQPDLADEFIDLLLSSAFQETAVNELHWGPVNSEVVLEGQMVGVLPHGELHEIRVDWSYIDDHKLELINEWRDRFYERLAY